MVTTLSPDRLAQLQDEDAEYALVDTRPADSYESWHVRGAIHFPFGPEEELDGRLEEFRATVGDAKRVITICAKGISSGHLAEQLESATDEYEVQAVEDGMKGWSGVYDRAEIDAGSDVVIIQVQRRATGCLGYVVGCVSTGEAIVVDPTADVEAFVEPARERDLELTGVVDTHVHADHISGGRELADSLEVPYYLGEHATDRGVEIEFTPLERNEVLAVGERTVKALYTPGHTSEMISLLVDDQALLTADTLHVDSTGRTELEFDGSEGEALCASEDTSGETSSEDEAQSASGDTSGEPAKAGERGARMLYETLHRMILAEPEGLLVLPGHVTVNADGQFEHGSPGDPIVTTVREARTGIDLLELEEDAFVDRMADAGEKPANYEEIIDHNRGALELPPEERVELELGPNNCSA